MSTFRHPLFKAGDYVKSSAYYETQFPAHIKANRGHPFRGTVKKVQPDGRLTIKWIQQAQPMTLHAKFVEHDPLEPSVSVGANANQEPPKT